MNGSKLYVVFDSASWRPRVSSSAEQVGYFNLDTGAWANDGRLPIADPSDTRRYHPGLASSGGKAVLVGGGCGYSSCSVGRDDVWAK